jgi:hypothetical protein
LRPATMLHRVTMLRNSCLLSNEVECFVDREDFGAVTAFRPAWQHVPSLICTIVFWCSTPVADKVYRHLHGFLYGVRVAAGGNNHSSGANNSQQVSPPLGWLISAACPLLQTAHCVVSPLSILVLSTVKHEPNNKDAVRRHNDSCTFVSEIIASPVAYKRKRQEERQQEPQAHCHSICWAGSSVRLAQRRPALALLTSRPTGVLPCRYSFIAFRLLVVLLGGRDLLLGAISAAKTVWQGPCGHPGALKRGGHPATLTRRARHRLRTSERTAAIAGNQPAAQLGK